MSKYCQNCGAEMPDNAKVCGYCGMPFDGKPIRRDIYDKQNVADLPKVKRKSAPKQLKLAVVAGIVIICIVLILPNFTGYNKLVKKVMNAYKEKDTSVLVDVASGTFKSATTAQYGAAFSDYYYQQMLEAYIIDSAKRDWEQFENDVGIDYNLSYRILDVAKKTKEELNEILKESDVYDIKIQDGATVTVEATAKQGKNTSTTTITLVLYKEDGTWKLFAIE